MIETNPQDFDDFEGLRCLLQDCFAYMSGRIDPPSSLDRMSVQDLGQKAKTETLFLYRDQNGTPQACLFAAQRKEALYLGKLAVAQNLRGQGIGRALIEQAASYAQSAGLCALELQTRVELVENHALFSRLGFLEIARSTHEGFDHPTSISFRRML